MKHAENWNGQDVTLCGIGNDAGDDHDVTGETSNPEYVDFREKVTCPDCLRVIAYVYGCFTPTGQRREMKVEETP